MELGWLKVLVPVTTGVVNNGREGRKPTRYGQYQEETVALKIEAMVTYPA